MHAFDISQKLGNNPSPLAKRAISTAVKITFDKKAKSQKKKKTFN